MIGLQELTKLCPNSKSVKPQLCSKPQLKCLQQMEAETMHIQYHTHTCVQLISATADYYTHVYFIVLPLKL